MSEALPFDESSELGSRLRSARIASGLTPHEVARAISRRSPVSASEIRNLEAGRTQTAPGMLSALSTLYERPLNWFLEPQHVLEHVQYRNLKSRVSVRDLGAFEREAARFLLAYLAIEDHLDSPLNGASLPRFRGTVDPRAAANEVRCSLGLREADPVPSMMEALEHFGVRVVEMPTQLAIDGLAARVAGAYAVVLSAGVPRDRARLNAGHELAHIIFGDCDGVEPAATSEPRASTFASHLLLTSTMLREAFRGQSMVRLVKFKERYGISLAAMIYRATQEGILAQSMSRKLWIEFSKRGWRRREPGDVRDDRAVRIESLLDLALIERDCDLGEVARITGLSEQEVSARIAFALGRTAEDETNDHMEVDRRFRLRLAK